MWIETGNLLLASLMVKKARSGDIEKGPRLKAPTLYCIDDYRCV